MSETEIADHGWPNVLVLLCEERFERIALQSLGLPVPPGVADTVRRSVCNVRSVVALDELPVCKATPQMDSIIPDGQTPIGFLCESCYATNKKSVVAGSRIPGEKYLCQACGRWQDGEPRWAEVISRPALVRIRYVAAGEPDPSGSTKHVDRDSEGRIAAVTTNNSAATPGRWPGRIPGGNVK